MQDLAWAHVPAYDQMHSFLCGQSCCRGIASFQPWPYFLYCLVLPLLWIRRFSLFPYHFLQSNGHCFKLTLRRRIGANVKCLMWVLTKFPLQEQKIYYYLPFTGKIKEVKEIQWFALGYSISELRFKILPYLTIKPVVVWIKLAHIFS